jgi:hypothetical protein
MKIVLAAVLVALLLAPEVLARDRNVPAEFQRLHPCPSTGRTTGACPGYVRDHIVPLCKGGADSVHNMQWQTVAEGKAKDKWECK